MKTIEERIEEHVELRGSLFVKRNIIELELKRMSEKIMFHNTAIHNLRVKQHKD